MHLSDNLAKLAQLIDFGEKKEEDSSKKEDLINKDKAIEAKQPKIWPWEWLRNALA